MLMQCYSRSLLHGFDFMLRYQDTGFHLWPRVLLKFLIELRQLVNQLQWFSPMCVSHMAGTLAICNTACSNLASAFTVPCCVLRRNIEDRTEAKAFTLR